MTPIIFWSLVLLTAVLLAALRDVAVDDHRDAPHQLTDHEPRRYDHADALRRTDAA